MLKLRKGCKVPFNEKLFEGYERNGNIIYANVGADKIIAVLTHFISIHNEPLFFILELPTKLDEENQNVLLQMEKKYLIFLKCLKSGECILRNNEKRK